MLFSSSTLFLTELLGKNYANLLFTKAIKPSGPRGFIFLQLPSGSQHGFNFLCPSHLAAKPLLTKHRCFSSFSFFDQVSILMFAVFTFVLFSVQFTLSSAFTHRGQFPYTTWVSFENLSIPKLSQTFISMSHRHKAHLQKVTNTTLVIKPEGRTRNSGDSIYVIQNDEPSSEEFQVFKTSF